MTKFVPAIIAIAAMSTLAGCVAETGDTASEQGLDQNTEAACSNREGTNGMLALVANSMAIELGRLELLSDFEQYRGYNNQAMLRLKSTAICPSGGCTRINWLLQYQDSRLNNVFTLRDGTKVDSWNFASRLATGYDNMKTYKQNGQYKYDPHKLTFQSSAEGPCDTLNTFGITTPTGGAMTLTQTQAIRNALRFMEGNGPNPYIAFSSTTTTVSFDPGGETDPTGGSGSALQYCNIKWADGTTPVLKDQPCSCLGVVSTPEKPSTLRRKVTTPPTPLTLYCQAT